MTHGQNVNQSMLVHMPPSNTDYTVRLGEEEISLRNMFKYVGSFFATDRGADGNYNNRV